MRKRGAKRVDAVAPTPEQQARGEYDLGDVIDRDGAKALRVGKAYRRVRMVELLQKRGAFSAEDAAALKHYRHHADMIDRSPVRDSLNQHRGGNGAGPAFSLLVAEQVVRDVERAAGSLRDVLRAVVVDDVSLAQWAIRQAGAIDDCRTIKGVRVCRIRPRKYALESAELEIRMAACRVRGELDA
jgi:hypothetical protein